MEESHDPTTLARFRARFFAKTKLATEIRPGMATPCLEWQASRLPRGYGRFGFAGKPELAHRVAWTFANGPIPTELCVLHKCDNPPCVAADHLFLGTNADNTYDMMAKGRLIPGGAFGDANGSRLHPESRPRGDTHWSRLQPERLTRGDAHWSRLQPGRLAGAANGNAKLNEDKVRFIFQLHAQGWTNTKIADEFGVHKKHIGRILSRKMWKHVDLGDHGLSPQVSVITVLESASRGM